MNAFEELLDGIAAHGSALVCGVTVVLAIGVLSVLCCRSAAWRRSAALWTLAASVLYLVAAVLPLPRWHLSWNTVAGAPSQSEIDPSELRVVAPPQPAPPREPVTLLKAEIPAMAVSPAQPAAAELAPGSSSLPWRWDRLLAGLWLAAAAVFLLYALIGWARLWWLLRQAKPAPADLAAQLPQGRLLLLDRDLRPFAAGMFRPVVVLPRSLLTKDRGMALALLRHEAAHLQHRDPLLQAFLACLAVILGCHPLFWWLRREVRFQSERLADELASASGRAAYARQLLSFAEQSGPVLAVPGVVSVFSRPSELYRRIQMLLQHDRVGTVPSRWQAISMVFMAILLACGSALTFGAPAAAQQPAAPAAVAQDPQAQDPLAQAVDPQALAAEVKRLQGLLAAATAAGHLREYTVQRGDTLPKIATAMLGDAQMADQILAVNPGIKPERLLVGQKLLLPPANRQQRVFLPGEDGLPGMSVPVTLSTPPAAGAPSASAAAAAAAGAADLVSRYVDLVSERDHAAQQAQNLKVLFEAGRAQQGEATLAQARSEAMAKKIMVMQRLLHGEIRATESELRWLESKLRDADKVERLRLDIEIQRAKARMDVLHSVL
jgi:beta-lactamase regulating signal transducer with metallopeptidase domain/LysM repeat protein